MEYYAEWWMGRKGHASFVCHYEKMIEFHISESMWILVLCFLLKVAKEHQPFVMTNFELQILLTRIDYQRGIAFAHTIV